MTTRQALIDELNHERTQLLATIARLNDVNSQQIVHGDWRVQDILAHIASGEKGSLTYARMILTNRPMGATMSDGQPFDLDRWNQAQVERRRSKSLAEVVTELAENREATLAFVAEQNEETLSRRGAHPVFRDSTLADVIRSIAEADRHHLQEIADVIGA